MFPRARLSRIQKFRVERLVCTFHGVLPDVASPYFSSSCFCRGRVASDPSPVRARPLRFRSLTPHPRRNPKGFRNAFPTRLRRRNCAPPSSQHRFAACRPMAILLRRSFLRYRPSASRSGRGVAEESLTRLRPASRTHEPRQQVGTPRVATTNPTTGSLCSASRDKLGEASHRLRC